MTPKATSARRAEITQRVVVGDCVEVMRGMEAESIDAIVTDPPYGLGFMGRAWDASVPHAWAVEALRVLKPGGHLLAFGGTRTYHRLTCGIEDAGFEIRDCIAWLYGSGFPKSLNIGDGRGTALKPAYEPCVVARKPLRGTVAANVQQYGTGALNIDACRIGSETIAQHGRSDSPNVAMSGRNYAESAGREWSGRWPANVVLDEEAAAMLDAQSGERGGSGMASGPTLRDGNLSVARGKFNGLAADLEPAFYGDTGGASRFFYTAKASRSEREAWGRMTLPPERRSDGRGKDIENPRLRTSERVNDHPTVKPLALMEWLIKLVLPEGGIVLDPFLGSGTTLVAARKLNVNAIGIEQDERSAEIARQRIAAQWEVTLL